MDALLIWYLACSLGCGLAVYVNTRPKRQKPVRTLHQWLADMAAHTKPLDGYHDPIYNTAPMELERAAKPEKQ
jgi:hypothetical protein